MLKSSSSSWLPQSVLSLKKGYRKQDFLRDLTAGLTVGSEALPLAMAFAVASGVSPQAGLYCAVIAGFLISLLGGSRLMRYFPRIPGARTPFHLLLCGARPQPARLMHQAEFERHVGKNNICNHIEDALARAVELRGPASTADFDHVLNSRS